MEGCYKKRMLAGIMFEGDIFRGRMLVGRQHMKRGC